ncbi:MAG: hypothetical protein U0795_13975 [Pirellulales bacterium]
MFRQKKSLVWGVVLLGLGLLGLAGVTQRAWGIGFILGETKEELKLQYDVEVQDHGTGRVSIELTIKDEGRLKPLDDVQLVIPGRDTNSDGGHWMDLVVSLNLQAAGDGTRVGRAHLLREWAERAEIQLNTHTMDGKLDPLTRLHHVIAIAKYLPAPRESAAK